tara:strand:+ start:615 stop:830 length:216 start_codon:yes stop_codon:yes gene_type:complete
MSRKEYNPFPNASIINKIKTTRSSGASASAHTSSGTSSASSDSRNKASKAREGLAGATPSSSKRLRSGGRY